MHMPSLYGYSSKRGPADRDSRLAQAATQAQGTHEALEAIRKPTVEKWMRCGLVQVGVALPDGACFRIGEVEEDGG